MKKSFYLLMKTLVATTMAVFVTNGLFAQENNCAAPSRLQVRESNESAILTWSDECFHKTGFVGFNLYRNGEQIGEKSFRNVCYTDLEVELNTRYVYRLEAFYDYGCRASDSVEIVLTGQGSPQPPAMLETNPVKNADSAYDITLLWNLPYFDEPIAYGYCGAPAAAVTPTEVSTVYALIGWDTASLPLFEELYLVGMEYIVGTTDLTSLDGVVYIDNQIVHTQPMERYKAEQWERLYFTKAFAMNYKTELTVGYIAAFDPDTRRDDVIVIDAGPGKRGFSDIISLDGKTPTTLATAGIDANLCINALIVRQRDLEEAVMASDPQVYLQRKAMRVDASKTSSKEVKLLGFNVYRDMVRL
ncbi:MAG: hypothetical protein K2O37_00195, partial [Bacteroidales bacterium]|nr:hypothetical protein [Bacteroidales bacterium]